MSLAVYDIKNRPPGAMPVENCLQNIASAAHLRGVVATRQHTAVGEIPAADLMRALRGAWRAAQERPERLQQVSNIIRGVVARLQQPGPVQIPKSLLGICSSYAGLGAAKKAGPPQGKRRADQRKGRG